jgi:spore coat polysaccharide biosynthesis protein SpsF
MKTVAIVQARMGSTRLPGKILRNLAGKSVLHHVVSRVKRAQLVDEVIVATTDAALDDVVAEECGRVGVRCFRGSEQDVLERYYQAAAFADADFIVRVTADCPLFDPVLLDTMLLRFRGLPAGLNYLSNVLVRTYPRGLDAEIFTRDVLDRVHREALLPHQREHVTPYIYQNEGLFALHSHQGDDDLSHYRWTVDTNEDWAMAEAVYARLSHLGHDFGTADILNLLSLKPEIAQLNSHVEQKKLNS